MKQILSIITLVFSTVVAGQKTVKAISSISAYNAIEDLTIVNAIKALDLSGTYHISNGFAGFRLVLDSNGTFEKFGHDCYGNSKLDSGRWARQNRSTLVVHSGKASEIYDILKFDSYYFLILQTERQKFIKDFLVTKAKFKNAKPITIDNKKYTVDFMIGYMLIEKYYAKELEDFTGT
ncbi:hypothetical protein QTN47_17700 [Danxiaibacter flavus]|uniref:Uncharacterized protein n=1 Tax=Danxiaibacter flavus TaxID=3049108 RepID=A0ABV3ZHN2_9BACT|nr:hypothetical protein QNM32_17710 [Chitinophagaceae bacterium DXS]